MSAREMKDAMRTHRNGFSLMELMTVMLIMSLMMGIGTLALRGITRGAGISGAASNVRAVLLQARQGAIMNQRSAAAVFRIQNETNTLVVVTRYGRAATGVGVSTTLQTETELPWTAADLAGARVYNMTLGRQGIITGNSLNPNSREVFNTTIPWTSGDEVGLMDGEERFLPTGIEFTGLPRNPFVVQFRADGTLNASENVQIRFRERHIQNAPDLILEVDYLTGWISEVEEEE